MVDDGNRDGRTGETSCMYCDWTGKPWLYCRLIPEPRSEQIAVPVCREHGELMIEILKAIERGELAPGDYSAIIGKIPW